MKALLSACLGAVALMTSPACGQEMYGVVGNGSPTNQGALLVVDQATGQGTLIGDLVTPGGLTGVAFTSTGEVFASTIAGSGSTSTLLRLDPGNGSLVALVGPITDGPGGPAISIGDLATQPGTDVLFAIRSNAATGGGGGLLYTIDPSTAVATLVGDTQTHAGLGLAFAPDGTLYKTSFVNDATLDTLDPTTAQVIASVPTASSIPIDGLAGRPGDGLLFGTSAFLQPGEIYSIDPATGTTTFVGLTLAGRVSDLDFGLAVLIFADAFESGSTSAWSQTVP